MIQRKSRDEIEKMRAAGRIVAETLLALREAVAPGVSTWDLDRIAREECRKRNVEPAFLNYNGFPAALCASINEEVVHGIPSRKRVLKEGDVVGLDFGVKKDGWHGDAAITVPVGTVDPEAERLIRVTRESLAAAIARVRPGGRVLDVGAAVQEYVEARGFSVVRDFVGHGIGKKMHEEPQIPNYRPEGVTWSAELRPGMVLAIEPMINQGGFGVRVLEDRWTTVTADGKLSAHFEHTVAVTENGADVLTAADGL
jgi:methionyl aminopeptidase